MRSTYTYAVLNVSPECYQEIRDALKTAAYDHAFHENGVIDMHGIALGKDDTLGKISLDDQGLCTVCKRPLSDHDLECPH